MNIYVDESGSFVSADRIGSWNVVAAAAVPESSRQSVDAALRKLKLAVGVNIADEAKINVIPERQYAEFLEALAKTHLLLFATATDAGLNSLDRLASHQAHQVASIRQNIPNMKYESGRQGVEMLAAEVESVSAQLYVQLMCQIDLLYEVLSRSITYFAQRIPAALGSFRWRIDQKNSLKTVYEKAFEKIAPAILQSRSLREPMTFVHGFDYRHFRKYEFKPGEMPDYLETQYGMRVDDGFNIQRVFRENLKFEDSKASTGIQVIDLLASGTRRCLRGGFADNQGVAERLGSLMVQNEVGKWPIHLVSFGLEASADDVVKSALKSMRNKCRPMLVRG